MTTDISIYLSGDPPSPNRTLIADSGATITIANSAASFSSLAALPIPLRLMGISGPQGLFATHGKYQRLLVMVLVHDLGFEQYSKDPCLFRRVTVDPPSITLVSTHSDDLGASASSPAAKQYLITGLRRHFDLTVDDYSSHIGVVHTRLPNGGFDLSMPSKVAQLDRLVPSTGRTVRTPFPTSCDLTPPPDREGDPSARGGALRGGDATPPPPRGGGAHAQPAPAARPGTAPDSATTAAATTPPFHYNQVLGLVMWITFKVNIDLSRHVIGLAVYQSRSPAFGA